MAQGEVLYFKNHPATDSADQSKNSTAYKPTDVHRKSAMTFEKGKPVFILDDPQGMPWVMQAFSDIVDPHLTYDQLEKLGHKLNPALG